MAVVSGRMARADGVYISIERPGLPGAEGDRRGAQAEGLMVSTSEQNHARRARRTTSSSVYRH